MFRLFAVLCVLALLATAGCGRSDLVPASGKLTQGGVPVADAAVMLHYPSNDYCMGMTDSQGNFILTYNGKPGARPGKQIGVTVTRHEASGASDIKMEQPAGVPSVSNAPSPTPKSLSPTKPGKNLLPAEFGDPKNPKVTIDVPPGGTDKLVIALP